VVVGRTLLPRAGGAAPAAVDIAASLVHNESTQVGVA
jgi:hypothetical protein